MFRSLVLCGGHTVLVASALFSQQHGWTDPVAVVMAYYHVVMSH